MDEFVNLSHLEDLGIEGGSCAWCAGGRPAHRCEPLISTKFKITFKAKVLAGFEYVTAVGSDPTAKIYELDDLILCKQKSLQLLEELSLPKGLLPLEDIVEVGFNRSTGFVWLRQKKSKNHYFSKIGKTVSYALEITAFVEEHRMKKLTGVKSKELLIWITLNEMYIDDPASGKITFKTPSGISRSFPVSTFQLEQE